MSGISDFIRVLRKAEIGSKNWGYYCNKYLKLWKQLWNWVMITGWKSFEVCVRKNLHSHEQTLKGNAGETQKDRRKGARKAFILEYT